MKRYERHSYRAHRAVIFAIAHMSGGRTMTSELVRQHLYSNNTNINTVYFFFELPSVLLKKELKNLDTSTMNIITLAMIIDELYKLVICLFLCCYFPLLYLFTVVAVIIVVVVCCRTL